MADYDNNMSGVLFVNDRKEGKQPDYRGAVTINGHEYALAGWKRESKRGAKFLSLKVSEPQERKAAPPKDDNDIPW